MLALVGPGVGHGVCSLSSEARRLGAAVAGLTGRQSPPMEGGREFAGPAWAPDEL